MSVGEMLLLGVGLSMDSVAVSMCNAMAHRTNTARLIEMSLWFALFQGLMPPAGFWMGGAVSGVLSRLGGGAMLLILGVIGLRMIRSGLRQGDECPLPAALTRRLLMAQAAATSVDALAVGVGLRAGQADILLSGGLIFAATLLCSLAAVFVGRRFGGLLGKKAEVAGGVILLLIGIYGMF